MSQHFRNAIGSGQAHHDSLRSSHLCLHATLVCEHHGPSSRYCETTSSAENATSPDQGRGWSLSRKSKYLLEFFWHKSSRCRNSVSQPEHWCARARTRIRLAVEGACGSLAPTR